MDEYNQNRVVKSLQKKRFLQPQHAKCSIFRSLKDTAIISFFIYSGGVAIKPSEPGRQRGHSSQLIAFSVTLGICWSHNVAPPDLLLSDIWTAEICACSRSSQRSPLILLIKHNGGGSQNWQLDVLRLGRGGDYKGQRLVVLAWS